MLNEITVSTKLHRLLTLWHAYIWVYFDMGLIVDSDTHSPCRKVKRFDDEKDMMEESGYLSSQQTAGPTDADLTLSKYVCLL